MNQRKMLSAAILLVLAKSAWATGNSEYVGTPYENISSQSPKILKENTNRTGQIGKQEVDFFEILNNAPGSNIPFPIADVELEFSCPQAETDNGYFGWYISIWKHYKNKTNEYLKCYNNVSSKKCASKFSMLIDQNDDNVNEVSSYYIGIQSACVQFPNTTIHNQYDKPLYVGTDRLTNQPCDTSDYKLKIGIIPKKIITDTNTLTAVQLQNSIALGSIKTGQITSNTDNKIYSVETYSTTDTAGTNDVPLLFSCTAAAARQTNDWKLTVYDDKNTVVTGYPRYINGSDCGSTLVDDKGGFKFTLPKDSPRYFVSVQSACDSQSKKNCTVETSQYNIARDVTRIYTGNLSAAKSITATNASFKLTRCGLNSNSTIAVKVENADLRDMFKATTSADKKPIKLQIGTMACQILTPNSFAPAELMLGSITGNAEIIDAQLIAKDSVTVTLSDCISSNAPDFPSKITLTGTKLDLENLNPSPTVIDTTIATTTTTTTPVTPISDSVVIPVKVDIGDFHCEGRDAFYIDTDKPTVGDKTYSLISEMDLVIPVVDPMITALSTEKNLGASQKGQINTLTDTQVYRVDTGTADANLTFGCSSNTVRYQNDWKMLIYDSAKTLKSTTLINGSSCGIGQLGDTGTYPILLTKDSPTYYVVVKSACESNDTTCVIDKSQYEIKRITPAQAVVDATIKPCSGTGCTITKPAVKPFFH